MRIIIKTTLILWLACLCSCGSQNVQVFDFFSNVEPTRLSSTELAAVQNLLKKMENEGEPEPEHQHVCNFDSSQENRSICYMPYMSIVINGEGWDLYKSAISGVVMFHKGWEPLVVNNVLCNEMRRILKLPVCLDDNDVINEDK
jgi:hypothetical protein